jgi:hypothetical protein
MPHQVNRLTLPQAFALLTDEEPDSGDATAKMMALQMFSAPSGRARRRAAKQLKRYLEGDK